MESGLSELKGFRHDGYQNFLGGIFVANSTEGILLDRVSPGCGSPMGKLEVLWDFGVKICGLESGWNSRLAW